MVKVPGALITSNSEVIPIGRVVGYSDIWSARENHLSGFPVTQDFARNFQITLSCRRLSHSTQRRPSSPRSTRAFDMEGIK